MDLTHLDLGALRRLEEDLLVEDCLKRRDEPEAEEYRAVKARIAELEAARPKRKPARLCRDCGVNDARPGTHLCVSCE